MKLNNQQINALTQSFFKEHRDKLEIKNKASRETQVLKYKPLFDSAIKILKSNDILRSVTVKLPSHSTNVVGLKHNWGDWCKEWSVQNSVKQETLEFSEASIKDNIILATIDCGTVDDILKTLNKKYGKH